MRTPPSADASAPQPFSPSSEVSNPTALARRANSTTFGVRMHSLYPFTRSGWFWTSQRASASKTRGRLDWRADSMMQATVSCISGSRPRPGPMTREWRLGMRAAMVWAISEASEGDGWLDSRRRGCTIRLGE